MSLHPITKKVPILQSASHVRFLSKGFSSDLKFVADDAYLVRVFPADDIKRRRDEFDTIRALNHFSEYVPKSIHLERIEGTDWAYMVLSYLPGEDGEEALPALTDKEQYAAGVEAGRTLKKLHRLKAPDDYPTWFDVKRQKSDKYLQGLEDIPVDPDLKKLLRDYIKDNEKLLYDRPNTFQHDDFHPTNLLIHNRQFAGIIDFGRMDWGDPVHDLHKLGFFSSRISAMFTKGIVDGYHEGTGFGGSFWELYTLYSAMHIVSSLVWGMRFGADMFKKMEAFSYDVLGDHDDFKRIRPKWYREA